MKQAISTIIFLGLLFTASCFMDWMTPHDDTDPPGGRSGVKLIIDHATGCQYLSTGLFGSITPRIGAGLIHLGCKGVEGEE